MVGVDGVPQDRAIQGSLARIALDRLRALLPVLALGMAASLVASEPTGIPLTASVMVINLVAIAIATGLWIAIDRGRIPLEHAHVVGAVTCLLGPVTTIASQAQTGVANMAMLVMIELAASTLQVSTRWMITTTLIVIAGWLPFGIRDGGDNAMFQILSVVGAGITACVTHVVLRRSLIRSERSRLEEHRIAEQLARELAERHRAEAERSQIQHQLTHAQRMDAVGTLAAGLAHDMNNILTGVRAFAELIKRASRDPQTRDDCGCIIDEADRGAALTQSLLAFTHRRQYTRAPVALAEVLDSVKPMLSRTLPKAIQVAYSPPVDAVIDADIAHIGQAIINLCLNGADAMAGAGKLAIATTVEPLDTAHAERLGIAAGTWVAIAITDAGHGMDDETRGRIFEPFFTTKPLGKGTGLGLAIVYGTVHAHGGAIAGDTAVGRGTTFTIYLPASPVRPAVRPRRERVPTFDRSHVVMVVDDEPVVRTAVSRILEDMGLEVVTAADGEQALALFEHRRHDIKLVVLDMAMPGMGGSECFKKLRQLAPVPILIASGYAIAGATEELLATGDAAFVEKPFSADQLAVQVDRLIQQTS